MAKSQGAAGAPPCTSLLIPLMRINKFYTNKNLSCVIIVHFLLSYQFNSSVFYIIFDKQDRNMWKSDGGMFKIVCKSWQALFIILPVVLSLGSPCNITDVQCSAHILFCMSPHVLIWNFCWIIHSLIFIWKAGSVFSL